MYVCICNALTEKQVHASFGCGARSPAKVYKHHGCRPQCGKCIRHMRDVLTDRASALASQESADLLEAV